MNVEKIRRIYLHIPNEKLHGDERISRLVDRLEASGISFVDNVTDSVDLVLSVGGDGSFLRTVKHVIKSCGSTKPILGINAGHLGYLTAMRVDRVDEIVDMLTDCHMKVEERTMLEVKPSGALDSVGAEDLYALNEVAILKNESASMLRSEVSVGQHLLSSYTGDGLIVSTPTGSTGYNLSVGGPILDPMSPNWVISPIAAHSLTLRPLVVPDSCEMSVTTESRSGSFLVAIDGRSYAFPSGARLMIGKSALTVPVVYAADHHYANTLRDKLLWGVDGRYQ